MSIELILTDHQKAYLLERPKYGTNAACSRAIGIHVNTVANWRSKDTDFAEAERRMSHARDTAVFDPENFIHNELRPKAMKRMDEILSEKVTPLTKDGRVNTIQRTATEVLKGTGDLRPDGSGVGIAIIITQFREEGLKYAPSWQRPAEIIDVEPA
jgi:hypothetical protein